MASEPLSSEQNLEKCPHCGWTPQEQDAQANKLQELKAALLMLKHAYENDQRPNMSIVDKALKEA